GSEILVGCAVMRTSAFRNVRSKSSAVGSRLGSFVSFASGTAMSPPGDAHRSACENLRRSAAAVASLPVQGNRTRRVRSPIVTPPNGVRGSGCATFVPAHEAHLPVFGASHISASENIQKKPHMDLDGLLGSVDSAYQGRSSYSAVFAPMAAVSVGNSRGIGGSLASLSSSDGCGRQPPRPVQPPGPGARP